MVETRGSVLRPCEMMWHPIVYILLSTPEFPRARCARAPDLQRRSTFEPFPRDDAGKKRKVKEEKDRSFREDDKIARTRESFSPLSTIALSLDCLAAVAKNANANRSSSSCDYFFLRGSRTRLVLAITVINENEII